MKNTILELFLTKLNCKYTNKTIQEFQENPLNDNLLGISQFLYRLGIDTEGYKLSNATDLESLKVPFITIKAKKFAIVSNVSNNIV